jgi:hypothetical protein
MADFRLAFLEAAKQAREAKAISFLQLVLAHRIANTPRLLARAEADAKEAAVNEGRMASDDALTAFDINVLIQLLIQLMPLILALFNKPV